MQTFRISYFVTGTDTGVGKTRVSCALLHAWAAEGRQVVGMKPVAAGFAEGGEHDDVRQLRAASTVRAALGQINPYGFSQAVAPHLAARHVGVRIDLARIVESYRELAAQADGVIVEGAGGWRVPLNDTQTLADLARELALPVILVVGIRLGCLSHAQLTAEAIAADGLQCAGWVANQLEPDMPLAADNIEALRQRLAAPLLGVLPYQPQGDAKMAAGYLSLAKLAAER